MFGIASRYVKARRKTPAFHILIYRTVHINGDINSLCLFQLLNTPARGRLLAATKRKTLRRTQCRQPTANWVLVISLQPNNTIASSGKEISEIWDIQKSGKPPYLKPKLYFVVRVYQIVILTNNR